MSIRVTEIKRIQVRCACLNPVMLKWKNSKGNWDRWVFEHHQINTDDIGNEQTMSRYIEDYETADIQKDLLSKNTTPNMILGADQLTLNHANGLKWLLRSVKVMMLMNKDTWQIDGAVWQTVLVKSGTFQITDNSQDLHSTELTIEFPDVNLQTQ